MEQAKGFRRGRGATLLPQQTFDLLFLSLCLSFSLSVSLCLSLTCDFLVSNTQTCFIHDHSSSGTLYHLHTRFCIHLRIFAWSPSNDTGALVDSFCGVYFSSGSRQNGHTILFCFTLVPSERVLFTRVPRCPDGSPFGERHLFPTSYWLLVFHSGGNGGV